MDAEYPDEERREFFYDFLSSMLGIDPEDLGEADYANMFAEFEAEMFGNDPQANPFQPAKQEKPSAGREEARIKEIYRIMVRRLHPDLRADGDATVSAIWHEVQEAYEARNLDRLETLLALTEMESGTNGGQASLSQIRRALADFNRAIRAVQRSLREARRDPAWDFSRNQHRDRMEKSIRLEMEQSLSQQRSIIATLKRTIDDWSRPWHPHVKKPRKQSRSQQKPKAERPNRPFNRSRSVQTEFFAF